MTARRLSICLLSLCSLAADIGPAWPASFDLIVCGSGGEAEYRGQFAAWGGRLRRALSETLGHPAENIRLLTESGADADGASSREGIEAAIGQFAQRVQKTDDLFLYLIGHGNYRRGAARLNIPGPDLSVDRLEEMLNGVSAGRIVVVNAASASAPFINVLSGDGRIVCTSTRSAEERNATRFMESFIQALEEGSADRDRDGRISVLEICQQASSLTQAWYTGEGWIATEHALLDDNGDGLGSRLPLVEGGDAHPDGALAARCYLKDDRFPPGTPPERIDAYRDALRKVRAFIGRKPEIPKDEYAGTLEALLLKAARLHRKIRTGTQEIDN